jgi:FixJ family two-component response regulator
VNRTGFLVAVVDDELSVRTMLGRLLRLSDYNVDAYASGADFLAALNKHRPACAILDIHMPVLTGLELQSRLRAADIRVPVIFITGSDDVALDRAAQDAGAVGLLRKPFSSEELLAAVESAIASRSGET